MPPMFTAAGAAGFSFFSIEELLLFSKKYRH
jgi:hypothetical protein